MKTIKLLITSTIVSIIGITATKAQTDSSKVFLYQNEVFETLSGFNIPLLEFPTQDPCGRLGPAFGKKYGDSPIAYNPIDDWGLDTTVTLQFEDTIEKNVYWLHGLNGTVESWAKPALASEFWASTTWEFPARLLHSVRGPSTGQTYGEDNAIFGANVDVRNNANNYVQIDKHTEKDFIIAHSQGGIVAREWLRNMEESPSQFPKYAHGLVTFGTPHTGAQILNNTRPDMENKLPAFFNEACISLATAQVAETVNKSFLTRLLLTNVARNAIGAGCEILSASIIPYAMADYYKSTTQDYCVDAPFLTQPNRNGHPTGLSNYTLKVPVVQFYGVEETPVIWKLFSSTLEIGENKLDNAENLFSYDKDDQIEKKVYKMRDEFQALLQNAQNNYKYWNNKKCWSFWSSPYSIYNCTIDKKDGIDKNTALIRAYEPAIAWINNAPDYYLDIIGARTAVRLPTTIIRGIQGYINTYTIKENDGVVLAESAGSPILTSVANYPKVIKMKKTNHDQMKNSSETKQALKDLYEGNYGVFFSTSER